MYRGTTVLTEQEKWYLNGRHHPCQFLVSLKKLIFRSYTAPKNGKEPDKTTPALITAGILLVLPLIGARAQEQVRYKSFSVGASVLEQLPLGEYAAMADFVTGFSGDFEYMLPFQLFSADPGFSFHADYMHTIPKSGITLTNDDEIRLSGGLWLRFPFTAGKLQLAFQPEVAYGLSLYKTSSQYGAEADGWYAGSMVSAIASLRWIPSFATNFEINMAPIVTIEPENNHTVFQAGAKLGVLFHPFKQPQEVRVQEEIPPPVIEEPTPEPEPEPEPEIIPEPKLILKVDGTNLTPDGDGENDFVTFIPEIHDVTEVPKNWTLKITDSHGGIFRTIFGDGIPAEIIWDGKSDWGETVFSRNVYIATLTCNLSEYDAERTKTESVSAEGRVQTGIMLEIIIPKHEWKIVVNSITFPGNSASDEKWDQETKKAVYETLNEVAKQIKAHRGSVITIEGYANNLSQTEEEENDEILPLSQARAEYILEALAERGIPRKQLAAHGMGSKNPIVEMSDLANIWKNRRIEFVIRK